jgi:Sulfotransferase family
MSTQIAEPRQSIGEASSAAYRNPWFFLVGFPGPALDFMSRLLASHPHLSVAPHIHWITEFFETRNGINPEGLMARELLAKWVDQNRFAAFGLEREVVRDLLAPGERVPLAKFLDLLLSRFGTRNGKGLVGTVVPDYTQAIPAIHAFWPQARFIHAIQDGRDIHVAAKRPPNAGGEDPATTFALHWRRKVKQGRRAGKDLGPDLYHELLYEDFLNYPEQTCSRLAAFLTVPNDVKDRWRVVGTGCEPMPTGQDQWRLEMSTEEIERFEAAAVPNLERASVSYGGRLVEMARGAGQGARTVVGHEHLL